MIWALASRGNVVFSAVTDPGTVQGNTTGQFAAQVARLRAGRSGTGVTQVANGAAITSPDAEFVGNLSPQNRMTDYRAGFQLVWNVTPCFSFDFWGYWDNNNQGYGTFKIDQRGDTVLGNGSRNLVGLGVRPVLWILDNFAIQGQAGWEWIDHNRGFGNDLAARSHRGGNMGIFTIAPTIKPIGGYFTRPEIRLFATYAIWSHALDQGAVINTGAPPYNGNQNQGWLFGGQMEIWF